MEILILLGRILFAVLFVATGIAHFTQTQSMTGYAKSKGVPFAGPAVVGGGVALLAGGLSIGFGVWPDLGALALFLFLIPTAIFMHAFWRESDPQARQLTQIQFLKDISLAGAALALLGLFATLGDELRYVIVGPLFG